MKYLFAYNLNQSGQKMSKWWKNLDDTLSAISLILINTTLSSPPLSSMETNPLTPLLSNRIAWNLNLSYSKISNIFTNHFWTQIFLAYISLPKIF